MQARVKDKYKYVLNQSAITKLLLVVSTVQFLFIAYTNIFLIPNTMDNDSAKLFLHIVEMYRNKTIFIPNWSNMTTLEIDCAAIFALPLYAITKNIYLSFGISNIIILIIYLNTVNRLLITVSAKPVYRLVGMILLMTPFSFGQLYYYNMMFFAGGQYSIKILVPLVMLSLIIENDKSTPGIGDYICLLLLNILCLITGVSSGPYVLMTGILPIIIAYILCRIIVRNSIFDELLCFGNITCGSSVLSTIVGIMICKIKNVGTDGFDSHFVTKEEFIDSVFDFISARFDIYGAFPDGLYNVLTIEGIEHSIKLVFVLLVIIVALAYGKYCYGLIVYSKEAINNKQLAIVGIIMIMGVNDFILIATNQGSQSRYHLLNVVFAIILLVIWLSDRDGVVVSDTIAGSKQFIHLICFSIIMLIILVISDFNVVTDKCVPRMASENLKSRQLINELSEFDENNIIIFDDTAEAEILRMMDNDSNKLYLAYKLLPDEYSEAGLGVHDYYTNLVNDEILLNPHIMVVNEFITEPYAFEQLFGGAYEKISEYQNYKIYRLAL